MPFLLQITLKSSWQSKIIQSPSHYLLSTSYVLIPGLFTTYKVLNKGNMIPDLMGAYSPWEQQMMKKNLHRFIAVQSLSHVWLFATPWTAACQISLFFTISWSLLTLVSVESMMPSNHLILCQLLLLLLSIFPSIRVFSNEFALPIRWLKYWSFSISPSNEYSGLISCMVDWDNLLVVQGTLKSPLQHPNSKATILWYSIFFMVQLSHLYMTTRKTTALTI